MYGQDAILAVSLQSSGGFSSVASNYYIPMLSETLSPIIEQLGSATMRGILDANPSQEGKKSITADIMCEADPATLSVLLNTGLTRVSSLETAFQHHIFKPATADFDKLYAEIPATWSVDMSDAGSGHVFSDMNTTMLEFVVSNGELMTIKASLVGGTYTQEALGYGTAGYPTDQAFAWDTSSIQLGGVAVCENSDLTITIDSKLEAKWTLCNKSTPTRIKRTDLRNVSVAGTVNFADQTEYQKFLAQGTQGFIASFMSGSHQLIIKAPNMKYTEFPIGIEGPGEIEVAVSGTFEYSATSLTAVEIEVWNLTDLG